MVGPNFHDHKEIYVVQVTRADNGRDIVGLSAAGATGIKVGVNDAGVAAGSNIARTTELKTAASTSRRCARATARSSCARGSRRRRRSPLRSGSSAKTMGAPTSTPGNMQFADAGECWILETSYEPLYATEVVRDGIFCRANRFQVLSAPERPGGRVEPRPLRCAAARCSRQAERNGGVTFDELTEFSADHSERARASSSVCRHADRLPRGDLARRRRRSRSTPTGRPTRRIALGARQALPRVAEPESRIDLTADASPDDVPAPFLDGSAWRLRTASSPTRPAAVAWTNAAKARRTRRRASLGQAYAAASGFQQPTISSAFRTSPNRMSRSRSEDLCCSGQYVEQQSATVTV